MDLKSIKQAFIIEITKRHHPRVIVRVGNALAGRRIVSCLGHDNLSFLLSDQKRFVVSNSFFNKWGLYTVEEKPPIKPWLPTSF